MTDNATVRDGICAAIRTAWLASGTTSSLTLLWDDVVGDPPGVDANGMAKAWGRVTVRTVTSLGSTHAPAGARKFTIEGAVTIQIFTPFGDGHDQGDDDLE